MLYSPSLMYSPPNMYVQLVHVGWKIKEYAVVHSTSYVLIIFRCYQYKQLSRLLYFSPLTYSPPNRFVQLVQVGWNIREQTVVHATSYVLKIFCCYQLTQRCLLLYSPPLMYSPPNIFVQLLHVGWKIIE